MPQPQFSKSPLHGLPMQVLLDGARRGSQPAIHQLAALLMDDMEQYKTEIMEAILAHVNGDALEEVFRHTASNKPLPLHLETLNERSSVLLASIYLIPIGCRSCPQEKESSVALVRSNLSVYLAWMIHHLGHRPGVIDLSKPVQANDPTYIWVSGAIRGLMDVDPTLEADILASPLAVDIVMILWMTLDPDSKPLFLPHHKYHVREAGCAIIHLALKFISQTKCDNPSPLVKMVLSGNVCSPQLFADRGSARSLVIDSMASTGQTSMNNLKILDSCIALFEFTRNLLAEHPDNFLLPISKRCHVLLQTRNLSKLMGARVDEEYRSAYRERILNAHYQILDEWVLGAQRSLFANLKDALGEGQMLDSLAFFIKGGGAGSLPSLSGIQTIDALIQAFKTCLVYPKAVEAVHTLITANTSWSQRGNRWAGGRNGQGMLGEVQHQLLEACLDRRKALDSMPSNIPICDNFSHQQRDGTGRPFNSRACSSCQSVLYCSKSCQEDDWRARHRLECKNLRQSYLDQCHRELRYRQRLRAFHLCVLMQHFPEGIKEWDIDESDTSPMMAMVDMQSYPLKLVPIDVQDFSIENRETVPKYLRRRFDDLVAEGGERWSLSPYRMAQAVVRFGAKEVVLAATLTADEGPRKLRVLNSMFYLRQRIYYPHGEDDEE